MEGAGLPADADSQDDLLALLEAELIDACETETLESDEPAPKRARTASPTAAPPTAQPSTCPPHPGYMGGICIRCGALRDEAEERGVALSYIHRGLEVSAGEAERVRQGTADRLLASRKLLLILDLDHTLLNSSRFQEVPPQSESALRAQLEAQPQDAPMLYCLPHMRMWTKLRPGVRSFLQQANERFELAVYTMGDRDYAAEMARLLDPEGRLFHGRVISSGDSSRRGVKDLDVVLGRERGVLVLDDTEGVWPRHRDNLVQVERYLYFPADAARLGFGGQSLLERGVDEEEEEGALATCLRVMADVQQSFFQGDPGTADVRPLLRSARQAILRGVQVLFSRVLPLDCADPTVHPLWQLATKLGAQCVREVGEGVTHVVAADVTDKTRWACSQGKHVVSPGWLWCCAYIWRRAEEERFPVKPGGSPAAAAPSSEAEDVARALAAAGGGGAACGAQLSAGGGVAAEGGSPASQGGTAAGDAQPAAAAPSPSGPTEGGQDRVAAGEAAAKPPTQAGNVVEPPP